jgi:hypothetical protein
MVRGSMVVRTLLIDQSIVWHLTPHVGALPGRSVCPRAIYRG